MAALDPLARAANLNQEARSACKHANKRGVNRCGPNAQKRKLEHVLPHAPARCLVPLRKAEADEVSIDISDKASKRSLVLSIAITEENEIKTAHHKRSCCKIQTLNSEKAY